MALPVSAIISTNALIIKYQNDREFDNDSSPKLTARNDVEPVRQISNPLFERHSKERQYLEPQQKSSFHMNCSICGGDEFTDGTILSDDLVAEWQLAPHERNYIDRQQGTRCTVCGANLRSIVLANAIRSAFVTSMTLADFVKSHEARRLDVLEVNEAGSLSQVLRQLTGHILATYPEVDIEALPYSDGVFDLVVHSDTLEHVSDPIKALKECRRVLRLGAVLCFTVPTIVERLSRSREGMPHSYHGPDLVYTEFGADLGTYVLRAGFSSVSINTVDFPTALAITAR
jgi:SAM-dependent methyltransferase